MKTRNIIILAALILSVLLFVHLDRNYRMDRCNRTDTDTICVHDTIIVHDTIRIAEPKYITQKIVKHDTAWLPIAIPVENDTMTLANQFADHRTNGSPCDYLLTYADSVPVVIPITERIYKDRTYKAVVSGYDPKLVSLDIYSEKSVVHQTMVVKKQAKIALSAGVYTGFSSKGFDYGVGITLGVPIWSWTW